MTNRKTGLSFQFRGFTLLELLVVMALLSGVMLALGASMRTMARTEERIDQRKLTSRPRPLAHAPARSS